MSKRLRLTTRSPARRSPASDPARLAKDKSEKHVRQSWTAAALFAFAALGACRSSGCKQLDDLAGVQPEEDDESAEAVSERGLYDCTCDYLTDTDLSGEERVRVCAESPDHARKRGSGCAQLHSPGMINGCSCTLYGNADCVENDCRSNR